MTMKKYKECRRVRNAQILLAFLGVTVYGLQVSSLALGLVAMADSPCGSNFTMLNYTLKQKSLVSGMLGCGNTFGNLFAAAMSYRLSLFKVLPIASGILSGTMAVIAPVVAVHLGYKVFCFTVFVQGVGLSFLFPSVYSHLSAWVLPEDQGKFSWVWSGSQVGHLIMMSQSGILHCSSGGWPSIFYTPGIVAIIWGITFIIWGSSSPAFSQNSCELQQDDSTSLGNPQQPKLPWREIISSGPMWALLAAQISDYWVGDCLMRPIFLSSVCQFSVHQMGLILAIGNSLNIISGLIYAFLDVHLIRSCGVDFSRKFWTAIGLYGGAVPLLLIGILNENRLVAAICLVVTATLNSATHPGYMSVILNAAPNLAGSISGVFNTVTSMVSCTGPLYTGLIVKNENDLYDWRAVFITAGAVYLIGCSIFLAFGSTETQSWSCQSPVLKRCLASSTSIIEKEDAK